jgi:glucose uptake protein GlcU
MTNTKKVIVTIILVCVGLISYNLLSGLFVFYNIVIPNSIGWPLGGLIILIFGMNMYRDLRSSNKRKIK